MPSFTPAPVPPGPLADLFEYLQRCYLRAGEPSFRHLAARSKFSHSTVNTAIKGPKLPKWDVLADIHEDLGAEKQRLLDLWTAARVAAGQANESGKIPLTDRVKAAHRSSLELLNLVRAICVADRFDISHPVTITEQAKIHKGKINAVLFRPGSGTKATVGEDGMLRLWRRIDLRTPFVEVPAHDGSIYGAAFNRRGDLIATAGSDRLVKLWNVKDGSAVGPPLEHDRSVRDVTFGPDNDLLVSVSSDGVARIWNPGLASVVEQPFQRRRKPLLCSATSADGKVVAVGGTDGLVEIWDRRTGGQPHQLKAHTDRVKALAFHPTQPLLATSGMDRTVILWDTATGTRIGSYDTEHDGTVYSLAFSPDGSLLASGSYDGHVCLLAANDPSEPGTTAARIKASVRSVAFSPDGTFLVAVTADGSMFTLASTLETVPAADLEEVQTALENIADLTRT